MSAANFLANLPQRGTLTDPQDLVRTNAPPHLCDYDTSPPQDQVLRTDLTSILIRTLTLKRSAKQAVKVPPRTGSPQDRETKRRRSLEESAEEEGPNKREKRGATGIQGDSAGGTRVGRYPQISERELESYSVEKLKQFLKERGLPIRGRKEELLARAKKASGLK